VTTFKFLATLLSTSRIQRHQQMGFNFYRELQKL